MRQLIAGLWLVAAGCGLAGAEDVTLPRPRPAIVHGAAPPSFAEVAGPHFDSAAVTDKASDCDQRLAAVALFTLMPRLIGPGACGGDDLVELAAVALPDKTRVAIQPPALLRCPMAESFAAWLREEVAPRAEKLAGKLKSVENYDSYECRSRNRVPGAKISEHAHGNAIDVRAFHFADGRRLELTDMHVDKPMRVAWHDAACRRFTTVLGPGDPNHENHIHLDLAGRRGNYRLCHWDVREPPPPPSVVAAVGEAKISGPVLVTVPMPPPRPWQAAVVRRR
jgi:hypothetical protein